MTEKTPARDRLFALIASIPGSGSVEWCGPARALLDEIAAAAVRPPAIERTACRTTQHCAYHGWCRRCDPEFAAVMSRVNVAIQRSDIGESHWGPLYEVVGKALRCASLPEPADRAALVAERDALGREADRLRKDWVEMRTRAERAEANRAAVLREAAAVADRVMDERYGPDCSYAIGGEVVAAELRRMAAVPAAVSGRTDDETRGCDCPNEDAAEHMFGSDSCTCIPFICQNGETRYCSPTDTVDMISGWEIGRDCPHHQPAVGGAQPKKADNPRTVCVCGHTRGEHLTVSGRLLCDTCDPDSTANLVCRGFDAL